MENERAIERNIRDIRQEEAAKAFLGNRSRKALINAAPRFGKIRTTIKIMDELKPKKVLITFPRNDIAEGWNKDFKEMGIDTSGVEYVTFKSLKHKVNEDWDLLIIDEIQEASIGQLNVMDDIVIDTPTVALSGTITKKTEKKIEEATGINICYKYDIEQGVREGILCDYQIFIHVVDLDDKYKQYSNGTKTEKKYFQAISAVKDKMTSSSQKYFMELKQIKVLQNSLAKIQKTRELINTYEDQRLLIFTGLTEIANQLEIPVYHSKAKEKQVFVDFCNGVNYKHLATVKMMQAGVTVKPINQGIMNYISGAPEDTAQKICRFLGWEYENPLKQARIHIISSSESFELFRTNTALSFFESAKIKYI